MTVDIITAVSHLTHKSAATSCGADSVKFEGIEKRLEIVLRRDPAGSGSKGGSMRNATRQFWTDVLDLIHAKILDAKSTDSMDGYILSESSLFVSDLSITLLTCGTTKLLNCLGLLLDGIKDQGLTVEFFSYSRKNFMYPEDQPAPHCSLAAEYAILRKHFPQGNSFILGPLDGDHYFCYMLDLIERAAGEVESDQQLKLLMFDLDPEVCQKFFHPVGSTNSARTKEVRKSTGLDKLFEEYEVVQDTQFDPCGYSANALSGSSYCTIHVTPEKEGSYASFETTVPSLRSYSALVQQVLDIFKPGRFTIHVYLDDNSAAGLDRAAGNKIGIENTYTGYRMLNFSMNEFQPGYLAGAATFAGHIA